MLDSNSILNPPNEFFSFNAFNRVQTQIIPKIFGNNDNIIISAPTSTGKTTLFELLILKHLSQEQSPLKAIYISPLKSLCQEKLEGFQNKFSRYCQVQELTGDSADNKDMTTLKDANIILTTPEKWDSITRKHFDLINSKLHINLLLVDEIHILDTEGRGNILEAVITRMMNSSKNFRICAVSATIPNIKDLAKWLNIPDHNILIFGPEYRDVIIEKHVYGYEKKPNPFHFEKYLNYKLLDIIRKHSEGKPSLVFCTTQKGTIAACQELISNSMVNEFVKSNEHALQLFQKSKEIDNQTLKSFIMSGVAYHNASLSPRNRCIVENLFKNGLIAILCTTTTLAQGVNLPARLVIIKSTQCYDSHVREYSPIEIQQMVGRAGRPQYDTKGIAVIMTEKENVNKYLCETVCLPKDTSAIPFDDILNNLNTEIALRTFSDLNGGIDYFKKTLMYISLKNRYTDQNLQKILEQKFIVNLKILEDARLITANPGNGKFYSLPLGAEVSKFGINVETISKFVQKNQENRFRIKAMDLLCDAKDFEKFKPKNEEKKALKELSQGQIPPPYNTYNKKVQILLNAYIAGKIDGEYWDLMRQTNEIVSLSRRILICFMKFYIEEKRAPEYLEVMGIHRQLTNKCDNQPGRILQQIPGVGEKYSQLLVSNGFVNFDQLRSAFQTNKIDKIPKNEKLVKQIKEWIINLGEPTLEFTDTPAKGLVILLKNTVTSNFYYSVCCTSQKSKKTIFLMPHIWLSGEKVKNLYVGKVNKEYPLDIILSNESLCGLDQKYIYPINFFDIDPHLNDPFQLIEGEEQKKEIQLKQFIKNKNLKPEPILIDDEFRDFDFTDLDKDPKQDQSNDNEDNYFYQECTKNSDEICADESVKENKKLCLKQKKNAVSKKPINEYFPLKKNLMTSLNSKVEEQTEQHSLESEVVQNNNSLKRVTTDFLYDGSYNYQKKINSTRNVIDNKNINQSIEKSIDEIDTVKKNEIVGSRSVQEDTKKVIQIDMSKFTLNSLFKSVVLNLNS